MQEALTECGGDLAKAEDLLRIKSGAKASQGARAGSPLKGAIGLFVAPDAKSARWSRSIAKPTSSAKNEDFRAFVARSPGSSSSVHPPIPARCRRCQLASGETVEARRVALVQKIGENIALRRFVRREAKAGSLLCARHEDRRDRGRERGRRHAGQGHRDAQSRRSSRSPWRRRRCQPT
jgi:elongation factor Ts